MDLVDHIFSPIETLQMRIKRMDETISSRKESTESFRPASLLSFSLINIERCLRICCVKTTLSDQHQRLSICNRLIFGSSSSSTSAQLSREEDGMFISWSVCAKVAVSDLSTKMDNETRDSSSRWRRRERHVSGWTSGKSIRFERSFLVDDEALKLWFRLNSFRPVYSVCFASVWLCSSTLKGLSRDRDLPIVSLLPFNCITLAYETRDVDLRNGFSNLNFFSHWKTSLSY